MLSRHLDTIASGLEQPLDALGLLARALRHDTSERERNLVVDEVEAGLCQMRRRVSSLTDLLRAEHRTGAEHVSFPLMPLFEKLALQTARPAYDKRVRLSVVPTRAHAVSDPVVVEVVLRNLLINAIFFAPGGRALIGCRRRGSALAIQVCDNGIGIPAEDLPRVFEPLRKLARDGDRLVEGLGLGLTVSRDLAEAVGHRLVLQSTPSRGTICSLVLPSAPAVGDVTAGR